MTAPNLESRQKPGLYRARNSVFLGVCKGLSDYFDFSEGGIRLFCVVVALFTGLWPVLIAYIVAAMILKPAPVVVPSNEPEQEFYDSLAHNRRNALNRLNRIYEQLDRRTRRIESVVTSREFRWNREMRR